MIKCDNHLLIIYKLYFHLVNHQNFVSYSIYTINSQSHARYPSEKAALCRSKLFVQDPNDGTMDNKDFVEYSSTPLH